MTEYQPLLKHQVQKLRHELKLRQLRVVRTERLSPHMRRITLGGADLQGFVSPAHDDHVKLFFPAPGTRHIVLPQLGLPPGQAVADAPRPIARNYTPRRYDAATGELDIDFLLHGTGPASLWAEQAEVGDVLAVGGPRGSMVVPMDFDAYLLIGDHCALPAIARRLEELPDSAPAIAIIAVADATEEIAMPLKAGQQLHWLRHYGKEEALIELASIKLAELGLPAGDIHAWVAGELSTVRTLRSRLLMHGINKRYLHAASYWRQGHSEHHQHHDDE
jgi:NADPH-dependent ferric siderophore reductase